MFVAPNYFGPDKRQIFVAKKVGPTFVVTKLGRQKCVVTKKDISNQDCRISNPMGASSSTGRGYLKLIKGTFSMTDVYGT